MELVQFVTWFLSLLTVVTQVVIIAVLAAMAMKKKHGFLTVLKHKAISLSFAIAATGMAGSLFYSEIAGYAPCQLCWFQRILMYPMAILFLVAWLHKDKGISRYAIWLAGPGALLSGYHYLGQLGMAGNLPCPVVGYSISCAKVFFMTFGYITFPLMAFTAFTALFILQWINLMSDNT